MTTLKQPLKDFKDRLATFAAGQRRGIRNPFVIVPVAPALEQRLCADLAQWQPAGDLRVTAVWLDRLMPRTKVFRTVVSLPARAYAGSDGETPAARRRAITEQTLSENLTEEVVDLLIEEHLHVLEHGRQILLLLRLGSLYPFARASALLDELDRRRVRAAVGVPFPGRVYGGKLSFFGEEARHYYPAHRIDEQIKSADLP